MDYCPSAGFPWVICNLCLGKDWNPGRTDSFCISNIVEHIERTSDPTASWDCVSHPGLCGCQKVKQVSSKVDFHLFHIHFELPSVRGLKYKI